MAPNPPTVVSLKQSFLTTQTRLLSQPLTPTRAWQTNNNNNDNEDTALSAKAVDDALFKLNHRLQQHARRVYAPQATRHVAEQIDQLYWNAAEAATSRDEDEEDEGDGVEALNVGADLTDPSIITTLPPHWDNDDPSTTSTDPLSANRYTDLAAQLHALAERKQQATARVARLRRMKALLEPFGPLPPSTSDSSAHGDGEGAGNGVQENLVTRNGEVEAELHRMRMLLARVGGRVGQLKKGGMGGTGGREGSEGGESSVGGLFFERRVGEGVVVDVEMDERRKVGLLLERF